MPLQTGDPGTNRSTKRLLLEGPSEMTGGGNGVTGDDETSEDISITWDSSFIDADPGSCPLPPECYYAPVDATDSATLRTSLHGQIAGHQRYSWGERVWRILETADQDPLNPDSILDLYRNDTYPKDRMEYEQEHTWPSSFGFPREDDPPYTDGHMLFLADGGYNRARSNHPYRSCTGPECEAYLTLFNHGQGGSPPPRQNASWETGFQHDGSWETWIGRRGDVARSLFYMDLRYEGDGEEPDLILTDNPDLIRPTEPGAGEGYMALLSTLLDWHGEDPVDEKERIRNEVVYWSQRNPFIDDPDWALCVFEGVCPAVEPQPCEAGGNALFLLEGRFRVDVCWVTDQGTSGNGRVVPGAEHVGAFWFFDQANPEIYVKVLDACVDPFNRFWVFVAGLTNVEVTVTVTDTESGFSRTYHNPSGEAFESVQDTSSLDVCGSSDSPERP